MMRDFTALASGLIVPGRLAHAEAEKARRPKAMDFFAGAGGFSLGFINAGYEVVAAAEYDASAVVTYMTNLCRWGEVTLHFVTDDDRNRMEKYLTGLYRQEGLKVKDGRIAPDKKLKGSVQTLAGSGWISHQPRSVPGVSHIFMGDVRKLTSERILSAIGLRAGDLDCVTGGPPCQGYSTAGKRDILDPRNSLVFEYARFIIGLRPKAFVMEEVPNILNMRTPDGHPVVDQFCRIVSDGGYGPYEALRKSLVGRDDARAVLRPDGFDSVGEKPEPASKVDASPAAQRDLFHEAAE